MGYSVKLDPTKVGRGMAVRGLTSARLAELAGVNGATITSALKGRTVQLRTAWAIAQALKNVPVIAELDEFLERGGPEHAEASPNGPETPS